MKANDTRIDQNKMELAGTSRIAMQCYIIVIRQQNIYKEYRSETYEDPSRSAVYGVQTCIVRKYKINGRLRG